MAPREVSPGPAATIDRRLLIIGLVLLALSVGSGAAVLVDRTRPTFGALDQSGIAVGADGAVIAIDADAALVPGTRVVAGTPQSERLATEQLAWLAVGTIPDPAGVNQSMIIGALLDLRVLSISSGVPVAGYSPAWRYVWPRDAAFAAVAFSRTGHYADAERILAFLERVQPAAGGFEARYRPDGSGPPDDRSAQLDGLGWALWAMDQVVKDWPAADRTLLIERHRTLLDRASRAILTATRSGTTLPAASPDYWEVDETRPTLATAALLRSGLMAAGELYATDSDRATSHQMKHAGASLTQEINRRFGPSGYPRRLGGRDDSVDLGVTFLLPPFGEPESAVREGWERSALLMHRPAGGLAPGGSWKRDGISWTNATATHAMTAACLGEGDQARALLRWLSDHRTATGALPEKVLADGSPAAVAPLAWTAAAVIIAADALDR